MTQQHAPIRTKAANQMRPIESLCAALKDVHNVSTVKALAFHDVRLHPNHFLWRTKLYLRVKKVAAMGPLEPRVVHFA
jgi:hypothetical protein